MIIRIMDHFINRSCPQIGRAPGSPLHRRSLGSVPAAAACTAVLDSLRGNVFMTTDVRAVLLTSLLKRILMPRLGCLGRLRLRPLMPRAGRLPRRERAEEGLGQDAQDISKRAGWPGAFPPRVAW